MRSRPMHYYHLITICPIRRLRATQFCDWSYRLGDEDHYEITTGGEKWKAVGSPKPFILSQLQDIMIKLYRPYAPTETGYSTLQLTTFDLSRPSYTKKDVEVFLGQEETSQTVLVKVEISQKPFKTGLNAIKMLNPAYRMETNSRWIGRFRHLILGQDLCIQH
ncbi:MAG: hypothetical protein Q9167_005638 [Letrouitia subvulpina]